MSVVHFPGQAPQESELPLWRQSLCDAEELFVFMSDRDHRRTHDWEVRNAAYLEQLDANVTPQRREGGGAA
jgi:hypothetical protein